MIALPDILTERLLMRQPSERDLDAMPAVYNDPDVAANTISIPYPYSRDDAVAALEKFARWRDDAVGWVFFIEERATGAFIGSVGIEKKDPPGRGEMGYVIGKAWRGKGYATEAAGAVFGFAFNTLGLRVVTAHAMLHNPGSSRVLEKLGMRPLGVVAGACQKDGCGIDAHGFEITCEQWNRAARPATQEPTT